MLLPQGFEFQPNSVLDLRKAIYCLKQDLKAWWKFLKKFLERIGTFSTISVTEPCAFYRPSSLTQPATWIFAHVDYLVVISKDPLFLWSEIEKEFNINHLKQAEFLLGMDLDQAATTSLDSIYWMQANQILPWLATQQVALVSGCWICSSRQVNHHTSSLHVTCWPPLNPVGFQGSFWPQT
jgi:hypothetical protein